jgi:filamentous hemagglutinin family protein
MVMASILLVVMTVRDLVAGDILRPTSSTHASTTASSGTASSSSSATAASSSALDQLARTSQALQSVQAMQAAARALAIQGANNLGADPNHPGTTLPNVPNGLGVGGLQVDPQVSANPSLWSGASLPQQTVVGGQTEVTIDQNASQAVLNWSSFNIGKQTTLNFDQSLNGVAQSSWVVFNKVNDPTGIPSQILGRIQAPGQVYVIDANGIIFGGSAQVNVNTLVASALPINDNLVNSGLLNNPDTQFLFSSLPQAAGANGTPAYTPPEIYTPNGQPGNVTVQAGAEISTPTTAGSSGGRVFLIGANVDNQGEISTPDGQTILAAGLQVGLAAHDSSDPSLRGLDAYVGAVAPQGSSVASAGTVSNEGLINVPEGDITMVGAIVNQNGFLNSATSVSLNGRIDLLADYNAVGSGGFQGLPAFLPTSTGVVTLGPNSVTQILPDTSSDDTAVGTTLALPSQINMQGLAIYLAPDSLVLAPNANVSLNAGIWNLANAGNAQAVDTFVNASGSGQIYLDLGASIDVSGTENVEVPVSENIVAVQLTAAALADSPLLQDGPLHDQTIYVDSRDSGTYNGVSWVGTPLADASGSINLIQRSVGELTTAGGNVIMAAGESVIMQAGSTVNVSGGWINYQSGMVPVTTLIAAGKTYLPSQATPDHTYAGAVTSSEFEQGYIQGANGGALSITAPAMALDGNLVGNTVSGPRQQQQGPNPSSLSLLFQAQDMSTPSFLPFSPTPPSITFQTTSDLSPAAPFALDSSGNPLPLSADRKTEVILSPSLIGENGFGSFTVDNSDGAITVPAQVELKSVVGGSINLSAANMDIEGSVVAPGGNLQFTVYDFSPYLDSTLLATPPPDPTRGHFTLGPTGSLSVEGTVALSYSADLTPILVNGGTIALKSYSADLGPGSTIDASGGVTTSITGARTYGNGGSITIDAGQDPNLAAIIGGELTLDSSLQAFSGSKGGSLNILAPAIQIGGTTANPNTLLLSPDFFSSGGFSSFALTGLGSQGDQAGSYLPGVVIAPNTVIAPEVQSLLAVVNPDGVPVLEQFLQPEGLPTPVSLSLNASGVRDLFSSDPLVVRGDLVMGNGAVITTDPLGSVSLKGDTVAVLGSISAPGGTITISGAANSAGLFPNQLQALPTVDLGPQSVLSASGTTVLTPNAQNFRTGSVLPGGTIKVSGNIIAEAGSILDVSGANDVLDVAPGYLGTMPSSTSGSTLVPTRIDSDGGSIVLAGGQELISEAILKGSAGGPTASGGSLTVTSGRFYPSNASVSTPLDVTLDISQQNLVLDPTFYPAGETAIGNPVLDITGQPISGLGHFSASSFQAGGFDSLTLGGIVQFSGPVTISANRSITVADGGVLFADASVLLTAPYIELGQPFQAPQQASQIQTPFQNGANQPFLFSPTYGSGNLTVEATSLIDIGALSLQNIGHAQFIANGGDIRGDGTLEIAGALTFRAGQIYPPTDVNFTIAAFDYELDNSTQLGSVTIEPSGSRQLPLSAGGTLTVYASTINQDGVLRAPLGTIQLGWDGSGDGPVDLISGTTFSSTKQLTLGNNSVTSVSAIDPTTGKAEVIPYGIEANGTSWIDPTGLDITSGGVTAKSIQLSAANVVVNPNAQIDIRGGGDLYAYQWVPGNGGSQDILASSSSFAIIPSYVANYAPYAPYNPNPVTAGVFGSDAGYVNNTLSVGDQIHLNASSGLAAGTYTLLPARYALLPGAFLVTPIAGTPVGAASVLPGGSSLVSGYRFNDLNPNSIGQPLVAEFDVASSKVVGSRAQYDNFLANSTLAQTASSAGDIPPRLPVDAGQLVFSATQTMALNGNVMGEAGSGGLAGLVEISSPENILIAGSGSPNQPGVLVLNASELSSFNASLLIGGVQQTDATGTRVIAQTGNITVDNSGTPLTGPDIILVANQQLTLAPGADIEASSALSGAAPTILLGTSGIAGSGNGVLLRVSADPTAITSRSGVDSSTQPVLTIGAGVQLKGSSLIIDSTGQTTLDPGAILNGKSIAIASGQISLALNDPGNLQSVGGLVLSGTALQTLQSGAQSLSLSSYSSIDTYGTGQIGQNALVNLNIHAAEIRGFNQDDGTVQFVAQNILLDNSANGTAPGAVNSGSGTLGLNAGVITLGANQYGIDQFAQLDLNATKGILIQGSGGLTTSGDLTMSTPLSTGTTGGNQTIHAAGNVTMNPLAGSASSATLSTGLGAQLSVVGASITDNGNILLPSGALQLEATAGDVIIGNTSASQIDVGGTAKTFFDQVEYTDGGQVSLTADLGSVAVGAGSTVNVSAQAQGGNAGSVTISAPNGGFSLNGTLSGNAGAGGQGGIFQLDVGALPDPSLASLNAALNSSGFTESRTVRVRNGDVLLDGLATAQTFDLSADNGSIFVTGTIDASGATGGTIDLAASGSVTLEQNSLLTVAGKNFDSAGKGGSVSLDAGQEIDGNIDRSAVVDIQTGAMIDLSVAANSAQSAAAGDFTGTLNLRAPQTADNLDVQINPINGTIVNASQIIIEGYELFNLNNAGGATITTQVKDDVFANGTTFGGNSVAIMNRLLANNTALEPVLEVRPGAEIINPSGDLILDTTWDLSTFRFGPENQPGVLSLRAAGNLDFNYNPTLKQFASLSDGFESSSYSALLLPAGDQSWSYRLVAGADFGAANSLEVQPLNLLSANTGSLLLGNNAQLLGPIPNSNQSAQNIIPSYYQTIRTGTGDIEISAGRDIQLLSPLATIYTAGAQAAPLADFELPNLAYPTTGVLGSPQYSTPYLAQYSFGGGNVTLSAQNDIASYQVNPDGTLSPYSTKELPTSWLDRQGYIDPATGQFGITHNGGEVESTSWWVDFSNFFEGIGALGGGNVTLTAGRDVNNVDAVIPTNARMPEGTPNASTLVELGGGDLQVLAGRDINGGVYYVERGQGTLRAGNTIHTNPTRAALNQTTLNNLAINNVVPDSTTWLPTTLFLGNGSFDVAAQGDVLLGPVANPFLLPQGINNSFYEKSYFSTYAPADAVNVSSLTGTITIKDSADPGSDLGGGSAGSLANWYDNVLLYTPGTIAYQSQPWLRLVETTTTLADFSTVEALMPATLRATAFSGDLDVVGSMTLSPSPTGTLDLMAAGSINGLQPNDLDATTHDYQWGTSQINLSDADPNRIPGITSPLSLSYLGAAASSFQETAAWSQPQNNVINAIFANIDVLFDESGSDEGTFGVLQTQEALNAPGLLHADDPDPVHVYALDGDISGLTLFSPKSTRVVAGQDITDIALYLQNVAASDVSVVSAGRDIIAYDPNSQLRSAAQTGDNELNSSPFGDPSAGDIQINGPGTLEVLAGRNLNLGVGPNLSDGTGVGITSIGNARNPNLPFAGADIIAAAGVGGSASLDQSAMNFSGFITEFLDPTTANVYASRYLPQVATLLGLPTSSGLSQIWNQFEQLTSEQQDRVALDIFYLVLRDAGRDHNTSSSPGFGNYNAGFAAIAALFPEATPWQGDISLTSREIKTTSGGDISLLAPGGQLLVGYDLSGNQSVDQGILTEDGGNISIFAQDDVTVGTSRIFTLRGGNVIVWSSKGDIAAGASSKTVQSAPPTRVLVDPQSGEVETDLAGLATGGGIGVLTTVAGVPPGDVDLVAPAGTIDAGDAGIRVSGNINLAALQVLNVGNIQVQGSSAGVPLLTVSLNTTALQAGDASAAATTISTPDVIGQAGASLTPQEDIPSLISVEVLGYGGGEDED